MFRRAFVGLVVVSLVAGLGLAADKAKKGQAARGKIKKFEAATGSLTLTVKSKTETSDKEFKIGKDVKVTVFSGDDKKELSGADGLKELKEGVAVTVISDADGKVTGVQIGGPKKKK